MKTANKFAYFAGAMISVVLLVTCPNISKAACVPDSSSPVPIELQCKVFAGYQGWFRTPNDTDVATTTLLPETFGPGQLTLNSPQGVGNTTTAPGVLLILQNDGNLVVYGPNGTALWASNTAGQNCSSNNCTMAFQEDGNLVLSNNGTAYWASNTAYGEINQQAADLLLRDQPPYLEIVDKNGNPLWTSPGIMGWGKWGGTPLSASTLTVDMWPDVSEYSPSSLQNVPVASNGSIAKLGNGQVSQLFSSFNPQVIDLHLKWMQQYGIDGAFVQRFVVGMGSPSSTPQSNPFWINEVLNQVRTSAEKYQRQFVVMYDITGAAANPNCYMTNPQTGSPYLPNPSLGAAAPGFSLATCIENDWMNLVDHWSTTASPSYVTVQSKPLVVLWGVGINGLSTGYAQACPIAGCQYVVNTEDIVQLIQWFQTNAPAKYQAKVMGGTPSTWRTQTGNSLTDAQAPANAPTWTQVYKAFDIISPWIAGVAHTVTDVDNYAENDIKSDINTVLANKQGYLPVIYPGFSFYNASHNFPGDTPVPLNSVPRQCGKLYWEQFSQLYQLGINAYYVAMFDEVNEGTAIFKTAANAQQAPTGVTTLTLDADGCALPSDWYLQLSSQMSQMAKNSIPFAANPNFISCVGVNCTYTTTPAAPLGLSATAGNSQVGLSWSASPNATGYTVLRSTVSGGTFVSIGTTTLTSYTDTTVSNNATYYYEVAVVNLVGQSPNSSQVSATPQAPALSAPLAPTGVNAVAGNDQVALTWTASLGATSYSVYRSTVSSGPYTTTAPSVTNTYYTDTSVNNGTTYYYVVVASNGGEQSLGSTQISAMPIALSSCVATSVKPSFASGYYFITSQTLPASSSGSTETITENDPYQNCAATYLCSNGAFTLQSGSCTCNVAINSEVKCYYNSGCPSLSSTDMTGQCFWSYGSNGGAVGICASIPASDSCLNSSGCGSCSSSSEINAACGSANGASVSTAPSTNLCSAGTATSVTGSGPWSWSCDGTNGGSNASCSALRLSAPPLAPSGLSAVGQNAQVVLSWSASSGATSYSVYRSTVSGGSFVSIATTSTTSYTDSTVSNAAAYYYEVSATNSAGQSPNSSQVSATPQAPVVPAPTAPTGVSAVAGNDQVALSWAPSTGATSYNVLRLTSPSIVGSVNTTNYRDPIALRSTVNAGVFVSIGSTNSTSYMDTTVNDGMTYYYEVVAANSMGQSPDSSPVSATPQAPITIPAAPTGFIAITTNAGTYTGQVVLEWQPSTSVGSYNVKRSMSNGGPYTTIASGVTSVGYTDTSVVENSTYFYVVSAVNSAGESPNSSQISATPEPPPPAVPTGLSATAGNAQVVLSWPASTGATSYNVLRATTPSNGGPYTIIASSIATTTYTDTSAVNGTTYAYAVEAVNLGGPSGMSLSASATPQATVTIPAAPTGLIALTTNTGTYTGQVVLEWQPSTGARSYNVKRSTTNGGPYTTIASATSVGYTDTSVVENTVYYYVVSAVNSTGESPNSSQVNPTPEPPPPAVPTGLTATAGNAQVLLSWTASTGAISYNVLRTTTPSNGGPYTIIASSIVTTTYTDTSAVNGTTYAYAVEAVNLGGASGASLSASATPQAQVPTAPTNLIITPDFDITGAAILTWSGSTGTTSYDIYRSTTNGGPYTSIMNNALATNVTDVNLTPGITYYYVVTAVNANGQSTYSNPVSITLAALQVAAPTGLIALTTNAGTYTGHVVLEWQPSTGAGSYNIKRSTINGGPYTTIASSVTSVGYTDTSVVENSTYFYVVSAVNSAGESPNSSQISATPEPPPPAVPTGLSATAGNAQVVLSWPASTGATSYNVLRATTPSNGGPYTIIASSIATMTYTDTSVVNGTTYAYAVEAVNLGGPSGMSLSASATPEVPTLLAPTGLSASAGNSQVSLSWSTSLGATIYYVYRSIVSGASFVLIASTSTTNYVDTTVSNGTIYYYEVSAANSLGQSPTSLQVSAAPRAAVTIPAAPTGFIAITTNAGTYTGQVVLEWQPSTSVGSYNVKRSMSNGGPYTTIASGVTSVGYTDTSVVENSTYFYVVSAVNSAGESPNSSQISATPEPPPPAVPTGLSATAGNAQVVLSWPASTGATSYNVLRATTPSNGGPYTIIASSIATTTYTDTSAVNGTTYAYAVEAVNLGGPSGMSLSASATPEAQQSVPPVPTGVSAVAGNNQVVLTWAASSNATVYYVFRSTSSGGSFPSIASTSSTTYMDTTVTNGTTYYYEVSAANTVGQSPNSTQVSATPRASATTSPSGTTIPGATQIIDSKGVVWTVVSEHSYENGVADGGANITLLLFYNGSIYVNTTAYGWWSHATGSWQQISSDPRQPVSTSPNGTTIPSATQIIDSKGVVWTVVSEHSYENGVADGGANITLLLFYNGSIYVNTTAYGWWSHATGSWQQISSDPRQPVSTSPNGTTIPGATQIIDSKGVVWTVVSEHSYENGVADGGANITLLLFYNGSIYVNTTAYGWWSHATGSWQQISSDPRQPVSTSPNGTTIPGATQIIDSKGVVWTVVSEHSYENGVADGGANITLLLFYNGSIYVNTTAYGWWSHATGSWQQISSDPRQSA